MPPASQGLVASRVRQAIEHSGLTHAELARKVDLDPTALSKALSGLRQFKMMEIALIAAELGVSLDQLLSAEEPRQPAVAARVQPLENPAADAAMEVVSRFLDLDDLLTKLGYPAWTRIDGPEVDPTNKPHVQGIELAEQVRAMLEVDDETLPSELDELAHFIESGLGIDVCFNPLPHGLDGVSVSRGNLKLAVISSRVAATRQRYTVAHEVCHLVVGDTQDVLVDENVFGRKDAQETRANAFAAAFLMPERSLRDACANNPIDESLVASLLGRYRVSVDALAFRMHNVNIIDARTRDRIRAMSSSKVALRSGRTADLQARNDTRVPANLLNRAIEAYVERNISVRPLAALLGVDPEQLLEELSPSLRQGPNTAAGHDDDDVVPVL